MAKRKMLPTKALAYVPPQFVDEFIMHGHQKPERMWGKPACDKYRRLVGRDRLKAAHRQYLADKKRDPKVDIAAYRIAIRRKRHDREHGR